MNSFYLLSLALISFLVIFFDVQPDWIQYLALGISLSVFLVYVLNQLMKNFSGIRVSLQKKGFYALLILIAGLLIFFGKKHETVFDYSKNRLYSLQNQTIEWLKKLETPVTLTIFLKNDDKTVAYANWIKKQAKNHTTNLSLEIKNINREIQLTKKYDILAAGESVISSGEVWVKIPGFKEEDIVTGIARLQNKSDYTFCFSEGHGERGLFDESEEGLSELNQYLKSLGYKTKAIVLNEIEEENSMDGCGLFVLVSPQSSFFGIEKKRLSEFMATNTPIIFALEASTSSTVVDFLEKEGLFLSSHLVINEKNLKEYAPLTDIMIYPKDIGGEISKHINKRAFFPQIQSIHLDMSSMQDVQYHTLINTPAEESYRLIGDESKKGPFTIAVYALRQGAPVRAVFGGGKWLSNASLGYGDNKKILVSTAKWLLDEEKSEWVEPPLISERYIEVTTGERFWIRALCMYVFPGMVFLICFAYWFQRKRRA